MKVRSFSIDIAVDDEYEEGCWSSFLWAFVYLLAPSGSLSLLSWEPWCSPGPTDWFLCGEKVPPPQIFSLSTGNQKQTLMNKYLCRPLNMLIYFFVRPGYQLYRVLELTWFNTGGGHMALKTTYLHIWPFYVKMDSLYFLTFPKHSQGPFVSQ